LPSLLIHAPVMDCVTKESTKWEANARIKGGIVHSLLFGEG